MADVKPTILKFVLKTTESPKDVIARFHPKGQMVLNRTKWRGKESRSCGVTRIKGRPHSAESKEPLIFDIEVAYKPKDTVTYVDDTRYDGWTAMLLDRAKDGTLLDGHGEPLPEGEPPVYLPYEMYADVEFNGLDFGKFQGEFEVAAIKHLQYNDVIKQIMQLGQFSSSISSMFMAPRKHRPLVKIILTQSPSSIGSDGFGTRIINIDASTPQLQHVILDQLKQLVSGFMEGRYSISNIASEDFVVVELSDIFVDCTPNEAGKDSRFHCLREYVPSTFLDDVAEWVIANYEVDASVVEGERYGLVLKRTSGDS